MKNMVVAAVAAGLCSAAAFSLPAELVVISAKEVRPDEAAALYYLGSCGAGYLYNGSSAALGRVAPYRLLDRDAEAKDYYIVWAPEWVKVTAADFVHLGTAVRLSEYEILVGLERGLGPGALRAVDHRVELIKLEPVTPVEWRYDGEAPPTKKDPAIEGAINTITEEEYAGYIKRLQDYWTRYTLTRGCEGARDYLRNFFATQNLETTLFPFPCTEFAAAHYPKAGGNIYLDTRHGLIRRSRDGGGTWDAVWPRGVNAYGEGYWLDSLTGFAPGSNKKLAKTRDGGDTWDTVDFGQERRTWSYYPYSCHFMSEYVGWLGVVAYPPYVTPQGFYYGAYILKTTDGGRTWKEQNLPEHFRAGSISFFDGKCGWAANCYTNFKPCFIYTDNGGATWRPCADPIGGMVYYIDLAAVGEREAWAADRSNMLLHTIDGLNWQYVNPGVSGWFYNVEFPDAEHGYAAGSTLIATDDGGKTWREVAGAPEMECDLLAFADRLHGVVGDEKGQHQYRTDDGCKTFVDISQDLNLSADNVIGERLGCEVPEEIVIVGGHYDSYSDERPWVAPGAEDNASGTACAMAAARAFRNMSFKRTVRYVAFGAEEYGCIGSKYYAEECARRGEKVVAVLNADMVSYDEDRGARDDFAVAHKEDTYKWLYDYLVGVGRLYGNDLIYDSEEWWADHARFWDAGYPALGVIEGGKGEGRVIDYPYYHTAEDTLDKLHPALGVRLCRDLAATLAHLAGLGPYFFEPAPPGYAAVPFSRPFAVYPNPYCYSASAGGVNFVGLKSPAMVEIYDLAGRRVAREQVADGCDECVWRPATREGETLAPGVYLYRVVGREQKKAGKIVIAR